ncbi:MAG: ATP-binding cassette domain-containing protein [Lachnospiraceae bacterium]|nr:ATP-binding cassette domain-containing protein [Lachnospiraceae bacterium]
MYAIEVDHLVKEYKVNKKEKGLKGAVKNLFTQEVKYVRAVDDVSFKVGQGDIVAYIGPNGAGKSTTVKMMSGIMKPTGGEILVGGISPQKNRKQVTKKIGVVFGQRSQLNWDLRLEESFELLKRIYQIEDTAYQRTLKMLDEILEIHKFIDTPVRQLSLGQRMRGDLAAAMLHSPEILFLDEPTIGLDVEVKHSIRKFIKEINERNGTTIILTTHDLGDVQELCKRIIIIDSGKIIEDGALDELIDKISPYRFLSIDFYRWTHVPHEKAEIVSWSDLRTIYKFKKNEITAIQLIDDIGKQSPIKEISIKESDIDDVIRTVYQGKVRSENG